MSLSRGSWREICCLHLRKTDDFGYNIVRDGVHVHDFNATILHLMGIDHLATKRMKYTG